MPDARLLPAAVLREMDEQSLSELRLHDGADDLELGDYDVRAHQTSYSVGHAPFANGRGRRRNRRLRR